MKKRARPSTAPALALLLLPLVIAACAAASGSGWTDIPPAPTPVASAAAGASGAPGASAGSAASPGAVASAAAGSSPAPAGGASPSPLGGPAASGGGGAPAGQVIALDENAALQITDPGGKQVTNIVVHQGETIHFTITNTAGFTHNFYVGKLSDLEAANIAALTGTGDFTSGTKSFDYTFSDTSAPLGFGCMVPGHYQAGMKGTFTIQ